MTISRIMIVGGPGSGKTWVASRLAEKYALPVYSVDEAVWDRDGNIRSDDEIDRRVCRMAAGDRWIIEGGNTRTYADRVQRAEAVIRLSPPRLLRLYRVLRRNGFRRDLVWWTLRYDGMFAGKDRNALSSGRATAKCIEIRSGRELSRLMRSGIESF